MSIGAQLRDARKRAGLTIEDLSVRTKIQPPILGGIERDDFEQLPRGAVRRGFLRAYAREVGLDPEAIVREYRREFEAGTPQIEPLRDAAEPAPAGAFTFNPGPWIMAAVAIGLMVLLSYLRTESPPPLDANAVPMVGMPGVDPYGGPDMTPEGVTGTEPGPPQDGSITLDLEATATVWIEATADGARVFYQLAEAGERVRLDAERELVLRIGDASAVRYEVNGVPGRPAGNPGRVATLHITPENYQTFQAAAP